MNTRPSPYHAIILIRTNTADCPAAVTYCRSHVAAVYKKKKKKKSVANTNFAKTDRDFFFFLTKIVNFITTDAVIEYRFKKKKSPDFVKCVNFYPLNLILSLFFTEIFRFDLCVEFIEFVCVVLSTFFTSHFNIYAFYCSHNTSTAHDLKCQV